MKFSDIIGSIARNSLSSPGKTTLLAAKQLRSNVEHSGASESHFSSPVSTATVQKVSKLGVPKKTTAQTGWAGNVGAEWAKAAINKRLG